MRRECSARGAQRRDDGMESAPRVDENELEFEIFEIFEKLQIERGKLLLQCLVLSPHLRGFRKKLIPIEALQITLPRPCSSPGAGTSRGIEAVALRSLGLREASAAGAPRPSLRLGARSCRRARAHRAQKPGVERADALRLNVLLHVSIVVPATV